MPVIPLGPWRPDTAGFVNNSGQLNDMRNAIPVQGGWQPQRSLGALSEQTIATPVQGVQVATRTNGGLELFVAANGSIHRVPSRTGALEAAGSGFAASASDRWRFVQFGDLLLATNFADDLQAYDLTSGGSFGDLHASAPRAKYIAIVRDFPVVAHTYDSVDLTDAYRVRWPGFVNGVVDPTSWAYSLTTQADFQRVSDIGQITGLTGGEIGTVVGQQGLCRMSYGGSALFSFEVVERRIGCRVPNSVVQYRQGTYFWSPDGWHVFDGSAVSPIGNEKIDRFFHEDFDEGSAELMWAVAEDGRGHVVWAYPGQGHGGRCNRMLRFAPELGEWAVTDVVLDGLGPGKSFGASLDDSMFDNLDEWGSLDDPGLWLELPQTVAVADGTVQAFIGSPMDAFFQTGLLMLNQDGRFLLNRAFVLHDRGYPAMRIGMGERLDAGTMTWLEPIEQQSDGYMRVRCPGRTHMAELYLYGDWVRAQGIDLRGAPIGTR
jgi:hypothetical protein